MATSCERSYESAIRIASDYREDPLLVIPLGYGGLTAGLQTAVYLTAECGMDTRVYPARFSYHKSLDSEPVLVSSEIDHLRGLARDRRVVIYDEDVSTGRTLNRAAAYFEHVLETEVGTYASKQDIKID